MRYACAAALFSLLLASGCIPSGNRYIQSGHSMNAYEYVSDVGRYGRGTSHSRNAADVEHGLARLGFKVISPQEYGALPSQKKARTLLYRVLSHDDYRANATVTLEFYDRDLAKLFTFTGRLSAGGYLNSSARIASAKDAALKEVSQCYSGYDPAVAAAAADKWGSWEKVRRTRDDLYAYFDANSDQLNPIEGIWTTIPSPQYKLAIFRDTAGNDRDFVATIVSSEEPEWTQHQVKAEFQTTALAGVYTTTYYMRNHSKQGSTTRLLSGGAKISLLLRNYATGDTFRSELIKNYPVGTLTFREEDPNRGPAGTGGSTAGTGFLLSKTGLVVTNWHVIEDAHRVTVDFPHLGRIFDAEVALKDRGNDLAILRLKEFDYADVFERDIPFALSRTHELKQGEEVYTLGYPLGSVLGKSTRLSRGSVNSLFGIEDDPRLLQISNPLQPGNSGGPLFDLEAHVVGVVVASLNARYFYEKADIIPQNVNFAVKAVYLVSLVDMLSDGEEVLDRRSTLIGRNIEHQVERIRPFVAVVKSH